MEPQSLGSVLKEQGLDSTTPMKSSESSPNTISAGYLNGRSIALPDESQCPVCGYFDVGHPDVQRVLAWREQNEYRPHGSLLFAAQCRCKDIEAKRWRDETGRRLQGNLPHSERPRQFEGTEVIGDMGAALSDCRRFASLNGPRCLLLTGKTGTGKSHLLEAIGRAVLDDGWTVRYETASAFLDRLRHTFSEDSESVTSVVSWYQGRKVLLLDDLGSRAEKDWAIQELTDLVDGRMRNGWWLAVATNLDRDEMAEAVGDRLASRLYQGNEALAEVCRVTLTCPDYRTGRT